MADREILDRILDLARWAPSGDNTQPWRFEVLADDHIAVHGHDTRDWCIYDYQGRASHMAHGALLETLRIAATQHGLRAAWVLREGTPDTAPIYDVRLAADDLDPDPLVPFITSRVVQRRVMRTTPLTGAQRDALQRAAGPRFRVRFFESSAQRWRVVKLLWKSAGIRLSCPEAYQVHKEIIEWGARYSVDRIPEQAVGIDPLTAKLMKWVMQSWSRVQFFNRYLGGTIAPRVQLDVLPGLCCAAHALLLADRPLRTLGDFVEAGGALQRFWLTACASGLGLQPEMTPVIFRWYARDGRSISTVPGIDTAALEMSARFDHLVGDQSEAPYAFFCRIGHSSPPFSRSLRRTLADLTFRRPS